MEKNTEENKESSGFSGIKQSLKKLLFKPGAFENDQSQSTGGGTTPPKENVASATVTPAISVTSSMTTPVSKTDVDGVVKKIYGLIEKTNQPGIDYLELWNSANLMGGVSDASIQNAYVALNVASGNNLPVEGLVTSGEFYKTEIQNKMNADIAQKEKKCSELNSQKTSEKQNLTGEVGSLETQIANLQKELSEKKTQLATIDSKYDLQINQIKEQINTGKTALNQVLQTMQVVLDHIKKIKK